MRTFTPLVFLLAAAGILVAAGGCTPKEQKTKLIGRADRHFLAGQYEKAEPEYAAVLKADPGNAGAIGRLGLIYFDQGRLEMAGRFLGEAGRKDTNDLDVHLKLGSVYLVFGALPQARAEAVYVLDRRPGDEEAPLLLAETLTSAKDLADVRLILQKLSPPNARKPACEVALAALCLRQQPIDIAGAEAGLKLARSLNPKLPALYSVIGGLCKLTNGVSQADQAYQMAADLSPDHSPRRIQYAQFKIATGDLPGARKILQEIVKKTPDFTSAWLELARLAASEKNYKEATALLGEQLSRDPDNADGLKLGAELKLAQGEGAEAVVELERLAKRFPKSAAMHYDLARAYTVTGEMAKAAGQLREVLVLQPGDVQTIVTLAQMDMNRGDLEAGIAALKEVLKKQPQLVPAERLLAQGYRAQGDLEAELGIYRRLAGFYPAEGEFPYMAGTVLAGQNKRAEARQAFEHALELMPKYPASLAPLQQLVELDLADRQNAAAMQRVDQLITDNTNAPEPRLLKAEVLLAAHTPQGTNQAEAALKEATTLKPDYWAGYFALSRLYKDANQNQKALAELRSILAQNPKNKTALMMTGIVLADEKDYAGARDSYEKLLQLDPKFSLALNNLAYLYSERLGEPDKAYKLASQARDLMPYEPATADTLGWVLFSKHQYVRAAGLLEESANKLPKEAEVQFHLGMAQYMMGVEAAATRSLTRALDLGKDKDFNGREIAKAALAVLTLDPQAAGAAVFLEKRISGQPDDVIALARLAAINERAGDFEKAAQKWQAALRANPEDANAMIHLAELEVSHLNQTPKAFELAQAAYKLTPDDPRAVHLYGRLAYLSGDHGLALGLLRDAARQMPNDPEVLFELAEAAYSMGQMGDAVSSARSALKFSTFKRAEEARVFLELTDPAKPPPAGLVEKTLAGNSNNVPALMALAVQSEQKGDLKEARPLYEKIHGLYPHFAPAIKRLVILYSAEPENSKLASRLAVEATEAFPGDLELTKAMGTVAYWQQEWDRAARLLGEALAGKGLEDAKGRYYQGMADYQLKRKPESRQALQRAVDLHLAEPELQEAKRVLADLK